MNVIPKVAVGQDEHADLKMLSVESETNLSYHRQISRNDMAIISLRWAFKIEFFCLFAMSPPEALWQVPQRRAPFLGVSSLPSYLLLIFSNFFSCCSHKLIIEASFQNLKNSVTLKIRQIF